MIVTNISIKLVNFWILILKLIIIISADQTYKG